MKSQLYLVCILLLFAVISCNHEPITCTILEPKDYSIFTLNETITVKVEAEAYKDNIIQMQLFLDSLNMLPQSITEPPYVFTIQPYTLAVGKHSLYVFAYTQKMELGDVVHVTIKEE